MTAPSGPAEVSAADHLAASLAAVAPLEPLELVLAEAYGTLAAADVHAPMPLPAYDLATVDGYAVLLADVGAASAVHPVELPVVPGPPVGARSVQPGVAVRVSSGRPVPAGADAVVPAEWTAGGAPSPTPRVTVRRAPRLGAHLRRAGDDLAPGARVLAAGMAVGPAQVGLLAAVGVGRVRVHPRPRVVVLACGDGLLEVGDAYEGGHSYDGASHALAAACRECGATPFRVSTVPTTVDTLTAVVEDHLIQADAVLISATLRPATYDPVLAMLQRLGDATPTRVAVEPGGLQVRGTVGPDRTPVFVLPGDPVEALVSFEVFVRPVLRRLLGAPVTRRPEVTATTTAPVATTAGRASYVRASVTFDPQEGYRAAPLPAHPATLTSLAAANALLVVPPELERVEAGVRLPAVLLDRRAG